MNRGLVAVRYAKAVLEYAAENGKDGAVYEKMLRFERNLGAMPELREALENPLVTHDEKKQLVFTASGVTKGDIFSRFIAVVFANHREELFRSIALSYITQYRKAHRISVVKLVSVAPMDEFILERIKLDVERRMGGSVELETSIDESLVGGFVFQINDVRVDASVKRQLDVIRQEFVQNNRIGI